MTALKSSQQNNLHSIYGQQEMDENMGYPKTSKNQYDMPTVEGAYTDPPAQIFYSTDSVNGDEIDQIRGQQEMHHHQADVVNFAFRQKQGKHVIAVACAYRWQFIHSSEQPLTDQVAHKMLVRRADGTREPEHPNLSHEREVQFEHQITEA